MEAGIIRAKFRNGQDKIELMKSGEIYPVTVDLVGISRQFKQGHRIRVDIASSNCPRFDRNTNTGHREGIDGPNDVVIAQNTIYHDSDHPSAIFFPVLPGEGMFGNDKPIPRK
ncbi:CocE/NonD family hydrolase [Effusibacillus dendaii]|uniref:Xaa-Pro dipeptidyl-peptidase C-terminal domain-containing protein n=1 Tax=Effusibacillus dendaii TaxID=2743772 RepID=A0A7I8DGK1_9BACL|nr:CocE/NonD family hydrolase [Effusibacillus dendaii]BCJ87996.1 hypothetical protein skT53_29810 [Effusibacillus dendaii]